MVDDEELKLIIGAPAIAEVLGIEARQVNYLHSKGVLPTWPLGGRICTTRAELRRYVAERVRHALVPSDRGAA